MDRKLHEQGDHFEFVVHRGEEFISVQISKTEMAANNPQCLVNLIEWRLAAAAYQGFN